jgi:hypothetical protein
MGRNQLDRHAAKAGRYLVGYPNKSTKRSATVSVDPPSALAGATVTVPITVTGAKVSRQHKVVVVPPATLEAGLVALSSPITSANTATISIQNQTAGTIDGAPRNWTRVHLIKGSAR